MSIYHRDRDLSRIGHNIMFPFYTPLLTEMYRFDEFSFLFDEYNAYPLYDYDFTDDNEPTKRD